MVTDDSSDLAPGGRQLFAQRSDALQQCGDLVAARAQRIVLRRSPGGGDLLGRPGLCQPRILHVAVEARQLDPSCVRDTSDVVDRPDGHVDGVLTVADPLAGCDALVLFAVERLQFVVERAHFGSRLVMPPLQAHRLLSLFGERGQFHLCHLQRISQFPARGGERLQARGVRGHLVHRSGQLGVSSLGAFHVGCGRSQFPGRTTLCRSEIALVLRTYSVEQRRVIRPGVGSGRRRACCGVQCTRQRCARR